MENQLTNTNDLNSINNSHKSHIECTLTVESDIYMRSIEDQLYKVKDEKTTDLITQFLVEYEANSNTLTKSLIAINVFETYSKYQKKEIKRLKKMLKATL